MTAAPEDHGGATSFEVRAELERLLERDLLGPWDGPNEELPPGTLPAERYLLGRLVPHQRSVGAPLSRPSSEAGQIDDDPDTVDREVTATGEIADTDVEPAATIRAGTMAASSLGLSFSVPTDVEEIVVEACWGRYERRPSQVHQTEQGRPRTVWTRVPAGGETTVPLAGPGDLERSPDPDQEQVVVRVTIRERAGTRIVDLALVKAQTLPPETPDTARLYQAELVVTAADGATAIFVGHNDPELGQPPSQTDDERLHLQLLHRRHRQYVRGRQCAVDAEVRAGEVRAWRLRTTCFPAAEVPLVLAGSASTMPGLVLDMARLGGPELARDELVRALRPVVTGYRGWLDAQDARVRDDAEVAAYAPAGERAIVQGPRPRRPARPRDRPAP